MVFKLLLYLFMPQNKKHIFTFFATILYGINDNLHFEEL